MMRSGGWLPMKRAGELRLEYGKRDIVCRPTPHEPTGSRTPEPNRNDCLAELLKREHPALRIDVHLGNVGILRSANSSIYREAKGRVVFVFGFI